MASEGARAAVIGLTNEHEGDGPEVVLIGGAHGAERADHEDHREENGDDVPDLHVFLSFQF